MAHRSTTEMTREEWLAARKETIGSSDVPAIMQLSEYDTPRDVYDKKKGLKPEFEGNDNTEWGLELEDFCTRMFEKKNPDLFPSDAGAGPTEPSPAKIQRDNKIRIHSKYPWATSNLDRLIVGSGNPIILELKTTTSFAMKQWDAPVPTAYYAQVQWQMFVTGYKQAIIWVAVLDRKQFARLDVDRSEEFIKVMLTEVLKFVDAMERSDPSGLAMELADYERYAPVEGTKIEATDEVAELLSTVKGAATAKYDAEKIEKAAKDAIKIFIGENAILVEKGTDRVLATYKRVHRDGYAVPASDYRQLTLAREKKEKKQ